MNAHELKPPPFTELTNQQKYQRMRPKDLIEVRLISHSGAEPRWVEARIRETNKGGAFAKLVDGHLERFFHFSDCRVATKPDTQKPIASLGEIVKGQLPTLAPPPAPAQKPLPVFAPPAATVSAPHHASPAPTPPLVLFRREDPNMRKDKPRDPHPPTDGNGRVLTSQGFARALPNRVSNDPKAIGSRVGTLIADTRKARGITQLGLADLSSKKSKGHDKAAIYNSQVSQIELGKKLPNDDELLGIAEALELSLDQMIELRDTDRSEREAEARAQREELERQREREERAAREARDAVRRGQVIPNATRPPEPPPIQQTAPYRPEPPPVQPTQYRPEPPFHGFAPAAERDPAFRAANRDPYPEREPEREREQRLVNVRQAQPVPAPIVAMQVEFAGFVESLVELVPMPTNSELRKRWFACVMELYKLSGSAS